MALCLVRLQAVSRRIKYSLEPLSINRFNQYLTYLAFGLFMPGTSVPHRTGALWRSKIPLRAQLAPERNEVLGAQMDDSAGSRKIPSCVRHYFLLPAVVSHPVCFGYNSGNSNSIQC